MPLLYRSSPRPAVELSTQGLSLLGLTSWQWPFWVLPSKVKVEVEVEVKVETASTSQKDSRRPDSSISIWIGGWVLLCCSVYPEKNTVEEEEEEEDSKTERPVSANCRNSSSADDEL